MGTWWHAHSQHSQAPSPAAAGRAAERLKLKALLSASHWPPVLTSPVCTAPRSEGKRRACKLQSGDKVLYFKYAGDNMETPDGTQYVVIREDDVLCKA
jgi:hypothetical protein